MKTYVHIGQHKTGTSSIQHYLRDHKDELRDRGYYVPDTLVGFDAPSKFILNVYALAENRYSGAKTRLLKELNSTFFERLEINLIADIRRHYTLAQQQHCHSMVWSNEGLYLLNSVSEYQKLTALFKPYSSRIVSVCCFREKADYLNSYRKQQLKQGLTTSAEPDSYRNLSEDSWLTDYKRKQNLLIQCFDEQLNFTYQAEDNVQAFFSMIGISANNSRDYKVNITPQVVQQKVIAEPK